MIWQSWINSRNNGVNPLGTSDAVAERKQFYETLAHNRELLEEHHGSIKAISEEVGIPVSTLYGKLNRYKKRFSFFINSKPDKLKS